MDVVANIRWLVILAVVVGLLAREVRVRAARAAEASSTPEEGRRARARVLGRAALFPVLLALGLTVGGTALTAQLGAAWELQRAVRCLGAVPFEAVHATTWIGPVEVIDPPPFEWFGPDRATVAATAAGRRVDDSVRAPPIGREVVVTDLGLYARDSTIVFLDRTADPERVTVSITSEVAVDDHRIVTGRDPCTTGVQERDAAARLVALTEDGSLVTALERWIDERRSGGPGPFERAATGKP